MLCIIDKVPSVMLDSAMSAMIETKPVKDFDEGRTVTALQTMIEWLTQRPSPLLSQRIIQLLEGLHRSDRDSVLIEIAHASIEKVSRLCGLHAGHHILSSSYYYSFFKA